VDLPDLLHDPVPRGPRRWATAAGARATVTLAIAAVLMASNSAGSATRRTAALGRG